MHRLSNPDTTPHDHRTTTDNPMHHTPNNTTTLWQVEEADQEAAERARVNEWVAEHPDPVTAALARAEKAEAEVARLRVGIEAVRDEAWEPWLNRDWQHLDAVSEALRDLLNPPTEGDDDE